MASTKKAIGREPGASAPTARLPDLSKCESGEQRVDVVEPEKSADLYEMPFDYFLP
jgi:hypothetical protein